MEVKFNERIDTLAFISYFEKQVIKVLNLDFPIESMREHSVYTNNYGLQLPGNLPYADVMNQLAENGNIESARTTNA